MRLRHAPAAASVVCRPRPRVDLVGRALEGRALGAQSNPAQKAHASLELEAGSLRADEPAAADNPGGTWCSRSMNSATAYLTKVLRALSLAAASALEQLAVLTVDLGADVHLRFRQIAHKRIL